MNTQVFQVLFHDQDILLVEKKKAFISQRSDLGQQEGLYEFISRSLQSPVWPVHRLDREVLGLMVFGMSKKMAESLSLQFRSRQVRKSYSCWVVGRPPQSEARVVHYLKKNPKTNYTTVFPRPTEGAKEAALHYRVQRIEGRFSRLEIDLETGRSHQIRAQLAKLGCPIVGDKRYAKAKAVDYLSAEIHLKSIRLGFVHPTRAEFLEWKLPPISLFPSGD